VFATAQVELDQNLVADLVGALERFDLVVSEHFEATGVDVLFSWRDFFGEKVEFACVVLTDLLNVADVCDSCFKFDEGIVCILAFVMQLY